MKHASHTENRFVCLCEGCGNRPFNAPTEQSQWVSVSDNMPAIGEIVQVTGGRAYLDVNAAWWTVEESPPRKIQWNVTHWKPITPPQEEVEI